MTNENGGKTFMVITNQMIYDKLEEIERNERASVAANAAEIARLDAEVIQRPKRPEVWGYLVGLFTVFLTVSGIVAAIIF